mgnify:FL=1|jgi:hypothetical protein
MDNILFLGGWKFSLTLKNLLIAYFFKLFNTIGGGA